MVGGGGVKIDEIMKSRSLTKKARWFYIDFRKRVFVYLFVCLGEELLGFFVVVVVVVVFRTAYSVLCVYTHIRLKLQRHRGIHQHS